MFYIEEGSYFVQKEKISNNKHILWGCVESCLFAWLFMAFSKEIICERSELCVLSAHWSLNAREKLSYW